MAKFKAAGSRKTGSSKTKDARSNLAAVPCLLLVLTGAGHCFPLEREDETVRALSEHLALTAEIIVESRWGFDE